jgi:hypothetical protein
MWTTIQAAGQRVDLRLVPALLVDAIITPSQALYWVEVSGIGVANHLEFSPVIARICRALPQTRIGDLLGAIAKGAGPFLRASALVSLVPFLPHHCARRPTSWP